MEQKHPKRRKDKYNPYTIYQSDEKYYIKFYDIGKKEICMEITEELFQAFNAFELEDKRQLNIFDRHMVSAKYSCGFPDPQVLPIIVVDRYLDYFTTIMEDRLWQVLAKPVFRWRNRSGLSMNAARAA